MLGPAARTRSCRTFSDPPVPVLRLAAARSRIQSQTPSPGSARSRLQPPVVVPPSLSPVPYRHRVVDVEPGDPPGSRSGFTAPAWGGEGPAGCQLLRLGFSVTLLSKVTPWLGKLTPRDQEAQGKRACHCSEAGELRPVRNIHSGIAGPAPQFDFSFSPHLLPPAPFIDVNS